ncbi:MAG: SUF system NifU family Fe-S cluster assembly protein [Candidatus Eisenbacteria bacterium]|uniref:SUF system NifU family Fe-S cluster assembly protein n=1 Tax=Eiseniibacteriota bacterium TaxID=2212470 RepID=A0A948RUN5_UNCEI|nr:SUF system NifU family Fe-S cluster assembly protein [Candidatus Eisenbacteria bacterium]MBU1949858.1 SUF system NifU family Fe-S cluster assembly protein [Candidatus Eisenbacteria bacterium]MBU2690861.1 SUF system NifU family Fe-S cluster assembly protein [Candidatus Eisenbacteria bacterium]
MDTELRELYQQVILDHHKHPRNHGGLKRCHRRADGYNPLCGDRIHVELALDGDGVGDRVEDVGFAGEGCAICTASASMMTECLKGKTTEEAVRLCKRFHDLVMGGAPAGKAENMGKLEVFSGVREFPMRVKCATLPWHTLQAALRDDNESENEAHAVSTK